MGWKAPAGFDCSGLVQYVFAQAGKKLPRVTFQQEYCGKVIVLPAVQAGDLYFWGPPGKSYHVALACGNGKYIHAPAPGQNVKYRDVNFFNLILQFILIKMFLYRMANQKR